MTGSPRSPGPQTARRVAVFCSVIAVPPMASRQVRKMQRYATVDRCRPLLDLAAFAKVQRRSQVLPMILCPGIWSRFPGSMRCHTSEVTATGTTTPASLQRSAGSSMSTPSRRASDRVYWWITSPKREERVSPSVTETAPSQRSPGSLPGPVLPMPGRRAHFRSIAGPEEGRSGSPGRGQPRFSRGQHHTHRSGNGCTATFSPSRSTSQRYEDIRGPPHP